MTSERSRARLTGRSAMKCMDLGSLALPGVVRACAVGGRSIDGSGRAAFDALFLDRWDRMVRRALLIVGSTAAAEDVVQEAFTEVYARWDDIREPAAYLARCVTNGAIRHCGTQARERPFGVAPEPSFEDPEWGDVGSALALLTPRARAMVTLKFYGGLSEREIAEEVGCRPGTVGPTVTRALRRMATTMGGRS